MRRRRDERRAGLGVAETSDELINLVSRKLSALARLRALRQLDLEILRGGEILDRHAEASGRDLLDRTVAVRPEPFGILATLTRVGHRTESIESKCDRFVRLRRKRAERHRAADEMLDDGIDGFKFRV